MFVYLYTAFVSCPFASSGGPGAEETQPAPGNTAAPVAQRPGPAGTAGGWGYTLHGGAQK